MSPSSWALGTCTLCQIARPRSSQPSTSRISFVTQHRLRVRQLQQQLERKWHGNCGLAPELRLRGHRHRFGQGTAEACGPRRAASRDCGQMAGVEIWHSRTSRSRCGRRRTTASSTWPTPTSCSTPPHLHLQPQLPPSHPTTTSTTTHNLTTTSTTTSTTTFTSHRHL